jgi:hypothetical protein
VYKQLKWIEKDLCRSSFKKQKGRGIKALVVFWEKGRV